MGEERYFVLKTADINEHLTPNYRKVLGLIARRVGRQRLAAGKPPANKYLVINRDEAFIGQMFDVMRSNGVDI